MPTAIKQLSTQPAAITQLNLTAAIRTAMANAGFGAMPFDEYTDGSGNNVLIYQLVLDSTKTFGTIYLHVQITTALAVSERLSLDWNSSTNSSSTNTPYSTSVTFTSNTQILFTAIAHPELRLVMVEQGSVCKMLGYLRPFFKRSTWNEDAHAFGFIPNTNALTTFQSFTGSSASYYSHTSSQSYSLSAETKMSNPDPVTNLPDGIFGPFLFSPTSAGMAGKCSDDLAQFAATGLTRGTEMRNPTNNHSYTPLNPGTMGLAILTSA